MLSSVLAWINCPLKVEVDLSPSLCLMYSPCSYHQNELLIKSLHPPQPEIWLIKTLHVRKRLWYLCLDEESSEWLRVMSLPCVINVTLIKMVYLLTNFDEFLGTKYVNNLWLIRLISYLPPSGTFVRDIEVELWFLMWNVDNHSVSALYVYMHSCGLQDGMVISIWV